VSEATHADLDRESLPLFVASVESRSSHGVTGENRWLKTEERKRESALEDAYSGRVTGYRELLVKFGMIWIGTAEGDAIVVDACVVVADASALQD